MFGSKELGSRRSARWGLRILIAALLMIALATGGFVVWASPPADSIMPEARAALASDNFVTVQTDDWLAFVPNEAKPTTGLIFYQGGRVLAEAYAPLARDIAEEGYLVVIPYAPLNLAIFNTAMATPIIEHYAEIDTWVVGGHSLGGSAAAIYADANPEQVAGLVFVASRPADSSLLDDEDLAVLSIYGTRDNIATLEETESSIPNLPADTEFIAVEGGNHSQFGYYGFQSGDGEATISRTAQINLTVAAITELLEGVSQ